MLGCLNFNDHHTSHNLSTKIEETLINWNLQNKIIFAVSDNANNIKRALTLLQLRNVGCFAHTMNLIVQSALTLEKDLIEKVKNIVSRFRRSTNASQKLLTCQINSGIKDPKKLIQDICNRWNSTYYMLDRFVELEIYIRSTLGLIDNPPESLTSEEWTVVKELIQILQPFEEATKAVSGEKYMTASIIIIISEGLQNVCNEMLEKEFSIQIVCITKINK